MFINDVTLNDNSVTEQRVAASLETTDLNLTQFS